MSGAIEVLAFWRTSRSGPPSAVSAMAHFQRAYRTRVQIRRRCCARDRQKLIDHCEAVVGVNCGVSVEKSLMPPSPGATQS